MSEYMHLVGAEDVKSAGYTMQRAAESMQSAASTISSSVERLINALDEHARRIEAAMEPKP